MQDSKGIVTLEAPWRLSIRRASAATRVGQALGFEVELVQNLPAEKWAAAGAPAALAEVEGARLGGLQRKTEAGRPSIAQDMSKGHAVRRSIL